MIKKRNCLTKICNPLVFGYISTIGVVDEYRRLGIGKILLDKAICIMENNPKCIGVFLHVIEHNKSAIKFYKSLDFNEGNLLIDHYIINHAYFNARVFYRIFKNDNLNTNTMEICHFKGINNI